MSRYIDADALSRALAEMWYESQISVTGISVSELINKQPSIDIVFCKECKHWWNKYGDSACMLHSDFTVDANDYCSYGERKESE